jgi:putative transposase
VKYAFIKAHQSEFKVKLMCKLFGVSRSAFYAFLDAEPSKRVKENEMLALQVQTIFKESRSTYGTRRIQMALFKQGWSVSRRRIGKLMKQEQLSCKTKKRFKVTTDSSHGLPVAPNLLARQFKVQAPNRCWVGDISYIQTREGWLYLAVVIDLYSRQIVGWRMKEHMKSSLVNDALLMAIWKRKPKAGLVWHTDQGSQYASDSHRHLLRQHQITQSMSRRANCWDNAVSESFFHTLKTELIYHHSFKTREEAKQSIFEYIEIFYNRKRLHSANDYYSPVEFEKIKKVS